MATVSTDSSEPMCRVMEIPGFGPIGVGRFVAALGDGQAFKYGRVVLAKETYYTTIRYCCDGLTTPMRGALVNEADCC